MDHQLSLVCMHSSIFRALDRKSFHAQSAKTRFRLQFALNENAHRIKFTEKHLSLIRHFFQRFSKDIFVNNPQTCEVKSQLRETT